MTSRSGAFTTPTSAAPNAARNPASTGPGLTRRQLPPALLALAAWPVAPAARAQAASTFALERLPAGEIGLLLAVRARLDAEPVLAIIDTGSNRQVVDPQLARRLAMPDDGSESVALAGARVRVRRFRLPPVTLRRADGTDAEWRGLGAVEADLEALRQFTGADIRLLLAMPWLAGYRATFDLQRGELRLDMDTSTDADADGGPGALDVPLRIDDGLPVVDATLSPTVQGPCLLDTGNAGAVVLFAHRAQAIAADAALPALTLQELGGSVSARYARSVRTVVGSYGRADVPVALELGTAARRGGHFDRLLGSLGMAFFDGGSFTIDIARQRLRVRHAALDSPLPGGFGFVPVRRGGGMVVASVFAEGPAARAGLRPGDRIDRLDGAPPPDNLPALWRAVRGHDQIVLAVSAADGTPRVELALKREAFFPPLP